MITVELRVGGRWRPPIRQTDMPDEWNTDRLRETLPKGKKVTGLRYCGPDPALYGIDADVKDVEVVVTGDGLEDCYYNLLNKLGELEHP